MFSGILVIDKPRDWTSHDVVAKLRGALKVKRIGHGGTLDPMATGVLPVFVGRATRASEFCENADKEYLAEITLGIVTDTQDITGNIISENEVTVSLDDLKAVLPRFTGAQKQIPPMYSAIKKDGKKLYELARRGIDVPREARDIFVSELEVVDLSTLRIVCSKGTYIRTLCHDIGAALGCGGTLSVLRRTRAGAFTIDMAHSLDDALAAALSDTVSDLLLPVDSIFPEYPSIFLDYPEVKKAKNGAECRTRDRTKDGKYRVYDPYGEFLLLGEVKNNKVTTIKSFFEV
ncbi:MAG: tRNA pseudouridine(55) synthase TruB [Oscillospiraceae bacterium]|nr:tRNA pseudouridine(55) synthase TruB [Oscillospiraceae bacterium]